MNQEKFQSIIGYQFSNPDFLTQALTHRSVSQHCNNERLEFLGDSVLSLCISELIYQQYPSHNEGELSRIRASLVKQHTLAKIAKGLNLGEYLNLGGGELKSGGFRRESILSDALEAVIAAVYLDSDYSQIRQLIKSIFKEYLDKIPEVASFKDPKTQLQEYLQAKNKQLPSYQVEQTTGKSHNQQFTVSCRLDDPELTTTGNGSSRKKAEQVAATHMLKKLLK